jgi:histidinol-phosphate aminotransferase
MLQEPPLSVRQDLTDVEPYVSPQLPARVRLNTNESPYPPPEDLLEEVFAALGEQHLNRYPNRDATALTEAIADHTSWPKDGVWPANGSNEAFQHLFLAFGGPGRKIMVFEPTYSLHSLIARITGTGVVGMPRSDDFEIDVDAATAVIRKERPDIVIACSPNNPTGLLEPLPAMRALIEEAPGLVVVDEAYIEFAEPGDSAMSLLADRPKVVISKTLSKAWRLAGARIGYLLAAPSIVSEMARVKLPYHLSTLTQLIGCAGLKRAGDALRVVESIKMERDRIGVELQAMGVRSWPSRANYVLFQVEAAERVWQSLLDRGVLVRKYSGVPALEDCLRVSAGRPEETDEFLAAIRELLP